MNTRMIRIIEIITYGIAPFIAYFALIGWSVLWNIFPEYNVGPITIFLDPIGGYGMLILSLPCVLIYTSRWRVPYRKLRMLALIGFSISLAFTQPNVIMEYGANLNRLVFTLCATVAWLDILFPRIMPSRLSLPSIQNKNTLKNTFINSFALIGFPLFITDVFLCVFKMIQTSQPFIVGGAGLRDGLNGGILSILIFSLIIYIPELLKKRNVECNYKFHQ